MSKSNIYQFSFKLVYTGPSGPSEIRLESGNTKRLNDFLFHLHHWALPGKLTPRLVDLLRIATVVYVSDRICRRGRTHADYGWSRSMSLRLPVFDVDFWTRCEVMDCLHRCLKFLSEDYIDLPHRYLTKAELVRSLRLANLEKLAMDAVSCIHYPLRESKAKQCGVCSACIFRRQAVAASGIDEPEGQYKYELLGRKSNEISGNKLDDLRAFLLQVDKLSSLDYSDQLPPCAMRHLRSTEVITDNRIPAELVSLYRRYRQEWLALIECGCKKGWEWAGMIAPTSAE